MKKKEILQIVSDIAQAEKIPEELISAVIAAESDFEYKAETPYRRGLMMLSEETLKDLKLPYSYSDLFDPEKNIIAGTKYFKELYRYWIRQLARWKMPNEIFDALVFTFSVLSYDWGGENVRRWLTQTRNNPQIEKKVADHFFSVVWWTVYFSKNSKTR